MKVSTREQIDAIYPPGKKYNVPVGLIAKFKVFSLSPGDARYDELREELFKNAHKGSYQQTTEKKAVSFTLDTKEGSPVKKTKKIYSKKN